MKMLKISLNEVFCFKQAESAKKKVDKTIKSMKDDFTQKLDELSKELKDDIELITKSSKSSISSISRKDDVKYMELLLDKAESCIDSKPSESSIRYLADISQIVGDFLPKHQKYQQKENSDKAKVEFYAQELIKETIPENAVKTFENLGDIEKHVERSVVAKLEKELQKLKAKVK